LLFAAGELIGKVICPVLQANQLEQFRYPLGDGPRRRVYHPQRKGDVLIDSPVREELKILEYHPNIPTQERNVGRVDIGYVFTVNEYLALIGPFLAIDQFQQRGFTGPTGAYQIDKLTFSDMQVNTINCNNVVLKGLGNSVEFDHLVVPPK